MKPPIFQPEWSAEVQALYKHDVQEIWDSSLNRHVWNQYQNQLDIYIACVDERSNGRRLEILDVGCAQATLALKLAERGHKVVANDIRQSFLDYAQTRYTSGEILFVCGNVLEHELGGTFDIIFANQIIEHLVYPEKLIARLKEMLKPGGQLVVTTPNWNYVKNDLPRFSDIGDPAKYEATQFSADADGHFFAYTGDELTAVFLAQKMKKVKVRYFETPFISGHMKFRHFHKLIPVSVLRIVDRALLSSPLGKHLSHQLMVVGEK